MTLDTSVSKAVFRGNGAAVDFPFSFRVWEESELVVQVTGADGAVRDVTTQCSVTLSEVGGTVHYAPGGLPLAEGNTLVILRNMPFLQDVKLITGTRFDPAVIEEALDRGGGGAAAASGKGEPGHCGSGRQRGPAGRAGRTAFCGAGRVRVRCGQGPPPARRRQGRRPTGQNPRPTGPRRPPFWERWRKIWTPYGRWRRKFRRAARWNCPFPALRAGTCSTSVTTAWSCTGARIMRKSGRRMNFPPS